MKNLGFLPVLMLVMVCFSVVGNCYAIQISNLDKEFRLGPRQSVFITETLAKNETIADVLPIYCDLKRANGDSSPPGVITEIKVDDIVVAFPGMGNGNLYFEEGVYGRYHPRYNISFGIQVHHGENTINTPDLDLIIICRVASYEIKPTVIPDNITEPF